MKITKKHLPYLTAIGWIVTAVGGIFTVFWSMYAYIDTKQIEAENKRFDQFHRIFEWVSGENANGQRLPNTSQAVAIYELSKFPEYKDWSLPIINYYLRQSEIPPGDDVSGAKLNDLLLRDALLYSAKKLSN